MFIHILCFVYAQGNHNIDNIAAGYNFLLSARGFYEPCLLLFRILKQDLPDILTIKARQSNVPAEAILSCISQVRSRHNFSDCKITHFIFFKVIFITEFQTFSPYMFPIEQNHCRLVKLTSEFLTKHTDFLTITALYVDINFAA